jgi:hypothetical protein
MEKTFLNIARIALLCVTALALLLTALSGIYGAFEFRPARSIKPPQLAIKLAEMTKPKPASTSSANSEQDKKETTSKPCQDAAGKINRLNKELGWEKKQDSSYNPLSRSFENKTVIVTDVTIDPERLCSGTKRIIDEENGKLDSYVSGIQLSGPYYSNLNSFLDEVSADSKRVQTLAPNDDNRYTVSSSFKWFNEQFDAAVDTARTDASATEAAHAGAQLRGAIALRFAAVAFIFFFTCCLILVFLRIEVNTRDLVAATQLLHNPPTQKPE